MSSQNPFRERELKKPNIIQKLLNTKPKQNSIIEINNLFANAESIKYITIDHIQSIASKYKVNLNKKFLTELESFYRTYLKHCLQDKQLSDNELSDLAHLKSILCLNDKAVEKIHNETASEIYQKAVNDVIADGQIDEQEKTFLTKLQSDLKLPDSIAQNIYSKTASKYLQNYIHKAVSDERVTPDEEKEIEAIAKNLDIKISYDHATMAMLDKYRLYWLIENGDIPEIDAGIHLQRNEKCHFMCNIAWHEHRGVMKRIRYGGSTLRIKIVKGVYWRAGDLAIQPVSEDVLMKIDSGQLFLTNKRLIFMGSMKNKVIRLQRILDFNAYKNGVDVQVTTGKSPFIEFSKDVDLFCMILGRVLRELD